jgi:hypothetical protein
MKNEDASQHKARCMTLVTLYPRWRCVTILLPALWYLLIPPPAGESGVNSLEPVSNWTKAGMYNTESDCQTAKNNFAAAIARPYNLSRDRVQNQLAIELSRCVAADDYQFGGGQPSGGQSSPGGLQPQMPQTQP